MLRVIPVGLVLFVLALFAVSCANPTPTSTPIPTATPTPTSTPTATPTPAPTSTPTATPTPIPTLSPGDARDMALLSTVALLPGTLTADWGEENLGEALGQGKIRYTHEDWVVTVEYPVVLEPDFSVNIVHEGLEIDWTGTVNADGSVDGPALENLQGLSPIMIITFTPTAMEDRIVVLVGEYRGWRPDDGPPPITKSDWVLDDKTGELYITGAIPDLDPVEDIGTMLTVTGIVKITDDGVPYLKAAHVEEGVYEGPTPR